MNPFEMKSVGNEIEGGFEMKMNPNGKHLQKTVRVALLRYTWKLVKNESANQKVHSNINYIQTFGCSVLETPNA